MVVPASVVDIHTPFSSFAIIHSLNQETLSDLYDKLSRKPNTDYYGERVGPGWLKYEFSDSVWNLDDDSDYTIFAWRMQQDDITSMSGSQSPEPITDNPPIASTSKSAISQYVTHSTTQNKANNVPTLHMHDPRRGLPSPLEYCNPSYYVFQAQMKQADVQSQRSGGSVRRKNSPVPSSKSKKGQVIGLEDDPSEADGLPKFKKQFNRFHEENGVRIVVGSIGPVQNVRMLLKAGYRHVYISRKFAIKHCFLPADAAPGHYGYGGLVNIGKWPIKLMPSSSQPNKPRVGYQRPDAFDQLLSVPSSVSRAQTPSVLRTQTPSVSRAQTPSVSRSQTPLERPRSTLWQTPISPLLAMTQDGNTTKSTNRKRKTSLPSELAGNRTQATEDQKTVIMDVYLSEEPHFDVVLGRSFFEKRQVKVSTIDPTDVVCLDTGEKIECELVILKDGKGEIVTVT